MTNLISIFCFANEPIPLHRDSWTICGIGQFNSNNGNPTIWRHQGKSPLPLFSISCYPSKTQTKTQVLQEDRYRGFLRTMSTIWQVCKLMKHRSFIPTRRLLVFLQQRGLRGYFDGASLRMSRKGLSSALGWMVYEAILMFVRTSKQHS